METDRGDKRGEGSWRKWVESKLLPKSKKNKKGLCKLERWDHHGEFRPTAKNPKKDPASLPSEGNYEIERRSQRTPPSQEQNGFPRRYVNTRTTNPFRTGGGKEAPRKKKKKKRKKQMKGKGK